MTREQEACIGAAPGRYGGGDGASGVADLGGVLAAVVMAEGVQPEIV